MIVAVTAIIILQSGCVGIYCRGESGEADSTKKGYLMLENVIGRRAFANHNALTMTAASLACAVIVGLSAMTRLYLPGTPVPVTLQTFALLTCSGLLGGRYAVIMVGWYIALGALGAPFFSGAGGAAHLMGPTGGYIAGFLAASALVGHFGGKKASRAKLIAVYTLGTLAIYIPGVIQLSHSLGIDWRTALSMGFFPFIIWDLFKATLACMAASSIRGAAKG